MIIPYGHERTTVRRLPWVTFGIMAACAAVYLVSLPATHRAVARIERGVEQTVEYLLGHPYLELGHEARRWLFQGVDEAEVATILEMARRTGRAPLDQRVVEQEQERLDDLSRGMVEAIHSLPHFRLGLIPAHVTPHGFISYQFMHGGWAHLLGNLFILFVVGPFVEDVWGRPLFFGFYLAAGAFAAVFYALRYPEVNGPLIGASGAVAGVMAAFGIRYWRTKVRFLLWLIVPLGRFSAPALLVFPLWFLWEFLMARSIDAVAPHAGGGGVAHWAHVAGFVFGAVVAVGVRHLRVEERFIDRAIEKKITLLDNTAVEKALEAREGGRSQEALNLLRRSHAADPDNVDVAIAWWNLAVDQGSAAEAVPAVSRVIQRALRAGEGDLAVSYWLEVAERVPEARLDPGLAVRMAELFIERNDAIAAREAIDRVAAQSFAALPGGVLVRLARAAARVESPALQGVLDAALENPDLPLDARAELEQLGERLSVSPDAAPAAGLTRDGGEIASSPGQVGPVVPPPARSLRLLQAVPKGLSETAIELEVNGRPRTLGLEQVQAVAVAGITRTGGKPYLLIDLLLDPPWSDLDPIRVVRLDGTAFDPRRVVGGEDALTAFRSLIGTLVGGSQGVPLPDPESARGNPFRVYESLEAYEREVLGAAGRR